MIQKNTTSRPADNCGVLKVRVFHLYRGFNRKFAFSGDFVKVSALLVKPDNPIPKKSKHRSIVIRTVFRNFKKDGSFISFNQNRLILLKKRLTPRGKALRGPVSRSIMRKKFISSFSGCI